MFTGMAELAGTLLAHSLNRSFDIWVSIGNFLKSPESPIRRIFQFTAICPVRKERERFAVSKEPNELEAIGLAKEFSLVKSWPCNDHLVLG